MRTNPCPWSHSWQDFVLYQVIISLQSLNGFSKDNEIIGIATTSPLISFHCFQSDFPYLAWVVWGRVGLNQILCPIHIFISIALWVCHSHKTELILLQVFSGLSSLVVFPLLYSVFHNGLHYFLGFSFCSVYVSMLGHLTFRIVALLRGQWKVWGQFVSTLGWSAFFPFIIIFYLICKCSMLHLKNTTLYYKLHKL